MFLLEGPFESDYSLAIVNRQLAYGLINIGERVRLHQRDNTTSYSPTDEFLQAHPRLAPLFTKSPAETGAHIHSRYIYPPFTDNMTGEAHVVHCYGWEESVFPSKYVTWFNKDIDVVTVMSEYVRTVLKQNGVRIPIVVVGLGADHILETPAEAVALNDEEFTFLHVSSCFPRKGVDVLVEAFNREFRRGEPIRLTIKTFPNAHNNVEDLVRQTGIDHPGRPPIDVWQHPMSLAQMRYLYEHAGCVVAPSRGEGFGLVVAEAMLLGCPVVATSHSGHADLCVPGSFWPVEYSLQRAAAHVSERTSCWAEPSVTSLQAQMRTVYESSSRERRSRTDIAKAHIGKQFAWSLVASKHRDICLEVGRQKRQHSTDPRPRVGFISSWNTKCGIAEYSRALIDGMGSGADVLIFGDQSDTTVRADRANVTRCWSPSADPASADTVLREATAAGVDAVSIQYNFGFFGPEALARLIAALKTGGVSVFVTLHSTQHVNLPKIVPALKAADICIVHRDTDLDRLLTLGVANTVVQNHGILIGHTKRKVRPATPFDTFDIASFGFFLPPKGIHDLIRSFSMASRVNDRLRLRLINAIYPAPESHDYAAACIRLIEHEGVAGRVELWTKFLPEAQIVEELSKADAIVMAYTHSTESASGAVRQPLASFTPVICSDLAIFDELSGFVHRYQAGDVFQLANLILCLADDPAELTRFEREQREYVENLSWPNVGERFLDLVKAYTTAIHAEHAIDRNRCKPAFAVSQRTTRDTSDV